MIHLKIDRIEIQLKGISESKAKEFSKGLGSEIAQQLSNRWVFSHQQGPVHLDKVSVNPIKPDRNVNAVLLRRFVGKAIAKSIHHQSSE